MRPAVLASAAARAVAEEGPAAMGAIGWIASILFLALLCSVIVLVIVLIRFFLLKTRAVQGAAKPKTTEGPVDASVSSPARFLPNHRGAAPVPPENPHSPPTGRLATPRPRTRT